MDTGLLPGSLSVSRETALYLVPGSEPLRHERRFAGRRCSVRDGQRMAAANCSPAPDEIPAVTWSPVTWSPLAPTWEFLISRAITGPSRVAWQFLGLLIARVLRS